MYLRITGHIYPPADSKNQLTVCGRDHIIVQFRAVTVFAETVSSLIYLVAYT